MANRSVAVQQLLQFIIVDLRSGEYAGKIDQEDLRRLGISLIDADLVDTHQPPYLDP